MKGVISGEARGQSVVGGAARFVHDTTREGWDGDVQADSAGVLDRVRQRRCIVYVRVSSCSGWNEDGMVYCEWGTDLFRSYDTIIYYHTRF